MCKCEKLCTFVPKFYNIISYLTFLVMTLFTDSIFLTNELEGFRMCRESRSVDSVTVILCTAGSMDLFLNGHMNHVGANDLWIRIPLYGRQLGEYKISPDCEFMQLTVHQSIFEELMLDHMRIEPRWWQKQQYLKDHPVFQLSKEGIDFCYAYFRLIELQLKDRQSVYRKQILMATARATTMEILSYLDKVLPVSDDTTDRMSVDRSDYTFHQFTRMLQLNPHEREVQWFAQQLAITPKYLSEICKARSGKSASEWIADVTVSEIKHRLHYSTMSIMDIAKEMRFPNASFFCQYTKKHTGMTPNQYRKKKR